MCQNSKPTHGGTPEEGEITPEGHLVPFGGKFSLSVQPQLRHRRLSPGGPLREIIVEFKPGCASIADRKYAYSVRVEPP